jgi:hypothetical protein
MKNLILMILVVILIIVDIVVLIELLNYGKDPLTTILFLVGSIIIIIAIVRTRRKTSQKSMN